MSVSFNQKSFTSGEWAPNLYARVDLQKYHSGAALLRNFFVDYRGGASTRTGTKYILQAYNSSAAVRLIPFSASFTVSYVLEFGEGYIRFYSNGSVVLETAGAITGITKANPANVTQVAHGYSTGQWVFITGVVGMTQVNSRYFQITVTGVDNYTLADLNGTAINSTAYTTYSSAGTGARVYTLSSPYAATDLATLKFAQNINTMVICHPSYPPYVLTLTSATNWSITPIAIGATVAAPTGVGVTTTIGAGTVNYSYKVTSVDVNGQESTASTAGTLANILDQTSTAGSMTVAWTAANGAQQYNVYRATRTYSAAVPAGAQHGYIGYTTGISFIDTNITADFSVGIPVAKNPFQGAGVASVTITAAGTYTTVPTGTFSAAPSGGVTATGAPYLIATGTPTVGVSQTGFAVGDILASRSSTPTYGGLRAVVATVDGSGHILTFRPMTWPTANPGSILSGSTPANPVDFTKTSGSPQCTTNFVWGVGGVLITSAGAGYTSAPTYTFSAGAAAGTPVLATATGGNPAVPAYFQQRLVFAAPSAYPQTFYMSTTGNYYNFNVSSPVAPEDAITGTIVSKELNEIKALVSMPSGLIVLSNRQAWQVNGGSAGAAITPIDATAQAQAYNGICDVPPIVANYDILYVQAKGSTVRDLTYDFYKNIFTGTDISVLSSHLFFGYLINEWAYAEEPFKLVWCVRSDGSALALTFMKEQEVVGWAHSDTNGLFKSVCSVTETVTQGSTGTSGAVDAVYWVVQRVVNGFTVKYIERMADRFLTSAALPNQYCWCVDSGLQYNSTPATTFTGLWHLEGMSVTGLADGVVIPATTVTNGSVTLSSAASVVTLGLEYTPQLRTLILDMGEPTVIGKLKKIAAVTVRAADTLGISFGRDLTTLVPMKDFSGSVNAQGVTVSNALLTTDARQAIDPKWDQDGQYYITQPYPLPATILGVVPEIKVEDRK
jgi:hypothetical protein